MCICWILNYSGVQGACFPNLKKLLSGCDAHTVINISGSNDEQCTWRDL